MNASVVELDLVMDNVFQIEEAVSCLLHTIMIHRTSGKLTYKNSSQFSIGSLGFEDFDCSSMDLTYTCISCSLLDSKFKKTCSDLISSFEKMSSDETK